MRRKAAKSAQKIRTNLWQACIHAILARNIRHHYLEASTSRNARARKLLLDLPAETVLAPLATTSTVPTATARPAPAVVQPCTRTSATPPTARASPATRVRAGLLAARACRATASPRSATANATSQNAILGRIFRLRPTCARVRVALNCATSMLRIKRAVLVTRAFTRTRLVTTTPVRPA